MAGPKAEIKWLFDEHVHLPSLAQDMGSCLKSVILGSYYSQSRLNTIKDESFFWGRSRSEFKTRDLCAILFSPRPECITSVTGEEKLRISNLLLALSDKLGVPVVIEPVRLPDNVDVDALRQGQCYDHHAREALAASRDYFDDLASRHAFIRGVEPLVDRANLSAPPAFLLHVEHRGISNFGEPGQELEGVSTYRLHVIERQPGFATALTPKSGLMNKESKEYFTLGLSIITPEGRRFGLTSAHPFLSPTTFKVLRRDMIEVVDFSSGSHVGTCPAIDAFEEVDKTTVDAAFFRLDRDFINPDRFKGEFHDADSLDRCLLGSTGFKKIYKQGFVSPRVEAEVDYSNAASFRMGDAPPLFPHRPFNLVNQLLVSTKQSHFAMAGDSGSALFDDTGKVMGVLSVISSECDYIFSPAPAVYKGFLRFAYPPDDISPVPAKKQKMDPFPDTEIASKFFFILFLIFFFFLLSRR